TGERDLGDTSQWNDVGVDFTTFSGVTAATLYVDDGVGGESSYSVTGFFNGFLEVVTPIIETGPATYRLEVSVTGAVIPATLDQLDVAGVDFSNASGEVVVTNGGPNNLTLDAAGGAIGSLDLQVLNVGVAASIILGISNASVVATGSGSVDVAGTTMQTADSVAGIEAGMTLIVSSTTTNGGRYTVASVSTGTPNTITTEEAFYEALGDSSVVDYPMTWRVTSPRRFSGELQELSQELIRQRVTYALNSDADGAILPLLTETSNNPSSPLKERLLELIDLTFGDPLLSVTGGEIIAISTAFEGGDYASAGIQEGDYVFVNEGPNRGFYPINAVDTGAPQQVTVDEANRYTTYPLTDEVGVAFDIYRGGTLQDESNQLVLFEYFNVLDIIDRIDAGIIMSLHDPQNLQGDIGTLAERPGDPTDATLQAHRALTNARLARISTD
ncbi:MAG TPA: hypothetical protein V6D20_14065, partial [Candidatus Obscuribacterales bacterium]